MFRLPSLPAPVLSEIPLPLLADGQPLPGRVRRLSAQRWWTLLLRGTEMPPGRSGLWLRLQAPLPLPPCTAELVYLAGDGTVLRLAVARPRWQLLRYPGARQVLVLRPGATEQLGLRPGLGLDLLA